MSESSASLETGAQRRQRWIRVALVTSVAANFLLVGLMAGAAWFRYRTGGPFAMAGNPMGFIRTLPKERRDAIRADRPEPLAGLRPMWQAVRQARREADRLLTAEPFDAAAFIAAQHRVIEADAQARRLATQMLAETAQRMTAQERGQMMRWRDRERWWRRGRGERHDDQHERGGAAPDLVPSARQ